MRAKPENQDIIEPLDILKMVSLAAQPTKWTAVENIIKPLEPEVVRQMLEQNEAITDVVQKVVASNLQLIESGNATPEEVENNHAVMEMLNQHMGDTVYDALNPTNITGKNRTRIDVFLEANPNKTEKDAIVYLKSKGFWN